MWEGKEPDDTPKGRRPATGGEGEVRRRSDSKDRERVGGRTRGDSQSAEEAEVEPVEGSNDTRLGQNEGGVTRATSRHSY